MSRPSIVTPETWELVASLARRTDLVETARAAFQKAYPEAPPAMLGTATFHVGVDGVGAALEWLAAVERFLRDPRQGLDGGATWHLLYHLYNWQQFQSLLPAGRAGVLAWLDQAKQLLAEGETAAVGEALKQLDSMFQGGLQPPAFE
jgi:hypothetical protein